MRIGELATKSGLGRDTIRFYERNGLITSLPGECETNNYRDYPEDSLRWLAFITGAREAGMSIADLRSIVEAMEDSCDPAEAERVLRQKIDELKERAAQIGAVVGYLEGLVQKGPSRD